VGLPSEQEETNPLYRFVSDLPEPLKRTAGGALRGLASSLEPLQLPQDAMFAVLAGAIDPNTTISDRLRSMNFKDYLPGGDAPPRPASGAEIFSLLGFDETTSKWAGIAADVLVDPLVFGSWLRVAGKATKMQSLINLGNRVDNFISPIGMTREVNRALRKSPHISNFMDARMEVVFSAFRDPNSTVFGIQGFGRKATGALDYVLPKGQVDRLRYGSETAAAIGQARREAARVGQAFPDDGLRLLWEAQQGPAGMKHHYLPQEYLKTLQEQPQAWKKHLESLSDPTLRDVIEREVYNVIMPGGDKPGVGFMTFIEGRRGIASLTDPDVQKWGGEAYDAIARSMTGVRTKASPAVDDIFAAGRSRIAREIIDPARENVGRVARERAGAAGLTGQALHDAEAGAIRVFNSYLHDTLQIDAKLGLITSGMPFVSRQIRSRAFEISGSLDLAEDVWYKVLRAGLKGGQKGIEELYSMPTSISLRHLLPGGRETAESMSKRLAYRDAVRAEISLLGRDVPRIRQDTALKKMEDILAESKDIWEVLYKRKRVVTGAVPNGEATVNLNRARLATREAAEELQAATQRVQALHSIAPSGASERQVRQMMARAITARDRAEQKLITRVRRERQFIQEASAAIGGTRVTVTDAGRLRQGTRRVATDRLGQLMDEVESIERRLRDSRFARSRNLQEVVDARRVAAEKVGVGPTAAAARNAEDIGAVPLAGNNTIADDIVAARMQQGNLSLEQAVKDNVTYGELIDGIMDMQALPLGEYLQGLMNGHLRRAYALFGDTDDFRRWVDNFKVGSIIPSSLIDETSLVKNMPGFEREAGLILQYHQAMSRSGRGYVLKRSGIADYLINSQVEPQRVNAALRSFMQSLGPEHGPLRDFLNKLDQMIPTYREAIRKYTGEITPRGDLQVTAGRRFFEPLEQIDNKLLEALGETAMARTSLVEGAEVARRVATRQEGFQNIYEAAKARGLMKAAPYTDEFGARFVKLADSEKMLGGFGGKYIHPHLYEELRKMSAVPKNMMPSALTRVRALITGGYLASPAVLAANTFGGFYQSATFGFHPVVMWRQMMAVAPDLDRASKGYRSDIVSEIRRHLNLDLTSLSYQDYAQHIRRAKLEDFGLGPQGVGKVFDNLTRALEGFLQKPGIGKARFRFAGLEGFQFTENWFKVAAYKETKEKLIRQLGRAPSSVELNTIEKQAAEVARLVVFDYSELPKSLEFLKNTGLVLFPGFTYFLAGRTISTAAKRPGLLAVADRLSEAVANSTLSLEDQLSLVMGMPDWMREDQGVPMPFTVREGRTGETKVSVIPLNQLIPTGSILDTVVGGGVRRGNPWAESISQMGVWGPFFEAFAALVHGEGEAVLSGRYGNRVFEADSEGADKAADVFRFLHNTLAPGFVKKMITQDNYGEWRGLIPSMPDMVKNLSQWSTTEIMDAAYSFEEHRTGRPDRSWREDVLSFTLRSPQVVALDGPIAGVRRELKNEQARLGQQLTALRRRANKAKSDGDMAGFERWAEEIRTRQNAFNERWQEFLSFYQAYEVRKAQERR
jgi:anion-transporting  ArsA/GET3 family ATPase